MDNWTMVGVSAEKLMICLGCEDGLDVGCGEGTFVGTIDGVIVCSMEGVTAGSTVGIGVVGAKGR